MKIATPLQLFATKVANHFYAPYVVRIFVIGAVCGVITKNVQKMKL